MNELNLIVLLGLLLAATLSDLSRHKIPNLVSLGGIGIGLILQVLDAGSSGLLIGLGGIAICFAIFIVPYAMKVMAAGDVKLMMKVGAFIGWAHALEVAFIVIMVGGVMGLGFIAVRGGLSDWLRRYGTMLFALVLRKPSYVGPRQDEAAATPFP